MTICSRALALEDDAGERVLLPSLDLVGLSWELSGAISAQAAEAAGVDVGRVLVSSTHTHSGPGTLALEGWGQMEPSYVESIPSQCAAVAVEAIAALHPVRIGTAQGTVRALGFNRVRVAGPIDRSLHVVRIDSMAGIPEVILFSHGCHPVSIDRRTHAGSAISADWPGLVARRLHEEGYGEAIFRLGVCGDVDPVVAWHQFAFEGMELSAELVTQALLGVLRSVETTPALELRLARGDVRLPLEPVSEEDIAGALAEAQTEYGAVRVTDSGVQTTAWLRFYSACAEAMRAQLTTQPEHVSVPLAALRVNDDVWLHLPGEVFTALGQAITARSPFARTVVTTLFGPFIGYLPDAEDFTAGGYAATLVPRILQMPPYSPTLNDALVTGALALLESLES
jgi:neutral ceramidase